MMKHILWFLAAVISVTVMPAVSAPKADLWEIWSRSDESSSKVVSHEKWQQLLDKYLNANTVDRVSRFAYSKVSDTDKQLLESYLTDLAAQDPRKLNKSEQFAYWVNLYNALTVNLVVKKYPVSSIRKIRFWGSFFGPWDKKLFKVAGESLSLNDIEHRILRPIWQDPRIHFVVNCASIGCPNLLPTAITADQSQRLLEQAAREFINHPRGVRRDGDKVVLSSIFDWYQADFGDDFEAVKRYLNTYLKDQQDPLFVDYTTVKYTYDWSLNEQK